MHYLDFEFLLMLLTFLQRLLLYSRLSDVCMGMNSEEGNETVRK